MQITTKFDIDDTAYFMLANKVATGVVEKIFIHAEPSEGVICSIGIRDESIYRNEDQCFRSKEELLASL